MNLLDLLTFVLAPQPLETGMTTAELPAMPRRGARCSRDLGLLQALGVDIVNWMRNQLL
jgi:hypothetical protein